MPFATAAVLVPALARGEPVDLTVQLDRRMTGQFDVSLLKNAALLGADAEVAVVSHTDSAVTLRVVAKQGLAGAGVVFVLCMPQTGPPATTPPKP